MSIKVCFLWVEQFRNLRDFNFNLDSSQKFHYNKSERQITRTNLDPLPKDFFPESLSEVTALIGKNGTGKSNALELICTILQVAGSALKLDYIKFDFILIYKTSSGLKCLQKVKDTSKLKTNFRLQDFEAGDLDKIKTVYYSNVFSERSRHFPSGVVDISPDHMHRPGYALGDKTTQLRRQIWFINNDFGFNDLGISAPTHVLISIDRLFRDPGIARYSHNESVYKFFSQYRKRLRSLSVTNKFVCSFIFSYFLRILDISRRANWKTANSEEGPFTEFLASLDGLLDLSTREISDKLLSHLEELTLSENFTFLNASIYTKRFKLDRITFQNQIAAIRRFDEWIKNTNLSEQDTEVRSFREETNFSLVYNLDTSAKIEELLSLFEDLSFFSMNWIGISSGQRAYLNLFSLIAYELRNSPPAPVFLCIDEGDLYLHPRWQIEFFKRLITVLAKACKDEVQLILTSHSPFLLTDLPKQNITLLNSESPQKPVDGWMLDRETFAANLYDLYAGPFFIDTLKTSMFAQEKITKLAQAVKKRPLSINRKTSLERHIQLIGDDIMKMVISKGLKDD